jgi:hypothetical protein
VNRQTLLASTAVALLMCSVPAIAQMQEKNSERTPGAATGEQQKQQGSRTQQREEPSGKGATKGAEKNTTSERSGKGEAPRAQEGAEGQGRTAEGQSREKSGDAQSREKGAQTQQQQQKGAQSPSRQKGAETQPEQKSGARQKGTESSSDKGAQTQSQQRDGKGNARSETSGAAGKSTAQGSTERIQVSEQQRQSVHQTLFKERNLNRVERVDFSISIGTRVPHTLRLAPLPTSVITLVPQYRTYRYFVANDEICIVDPTSYEIVEVIEARGQTAFDGSRGGGGAHAALVLTPEEQAIVLRNIDLDSGSTLGLGSLSEGAPVPRGVRIEPFPERVVADVPKLRDYKYFTAENRVAIVDPEGTRVVLVVHR